MNAFLSHALERDVRFKAASCQGGLECIEGNPRRTKVWKIALRPFFRTWYSFLLTEQRLRIDVAVGRWPSICRMISGGNLSIIVSRSVNLLSVTQLLTIGAGIFAKAQWFRVGTSLLVGSFSTTSGFCNCTAKLLSSVRGREDCIRNKCSFSAVDNVMSIGGSQKSRCTASDRRLFLSGLALERVKYDSGTAYLR